MDEQTDKRMDEWVDGQMDGWMMDRQIEGWMDDELMDRQADPYGNKQDKNFRKCMGGWINGGIMDG